MLFLCESSNVDMFATYPLQEARNGLIKGSRIIRGGHDNTLKVSVVSQSRVIEQPNPNILDNLRKHIYYDVLLFSSVKLIMGICL
jgi:hypothetical protein